MRTEIRTPLYMQLKNRILESFRDLAYYSPLPGERELCEVFNVSRPTVRKVLQLLESEKHIVRLPGKGSFYLGNKIHVDGSSSARGIAFYNEVVSSGRYTKSKVLLQNVEKPPRAIAIRLRVDEDEDVFHLERLRYIGDQLYSLANSYIPFKLCPNLLKEDFTDKSLYETLEKYGVHPCKLEKVLEIKPANAYEALHLEINVGDPVSVMQTVAYDEKNKIIECAISKSLAYNTRYEMTAYNVKDDGKDKKRAH